MFNLGRGLFFDGRYHNLQRLGTCSVQHEQRKAAVTRDETDALWGWVVHSADVASNQLPFASYLITPRCDVSMKRSSSSTSSPKSTSERSFSRACEVFNFDASNTLYAWCSFLIRSGVKLRRCSPTLFSMKACVSRSALVIE